MQFEIKDGQSTAEKWRTTTFHDQGEELEVELFIPDSAEWNRFIGKFRLGTQRGDWAGAQAFVAKKWWKSFSGAKDTEGNAIENTEQMRKLMLRTKRVWDFVFAALAEAQEEDEEGN